MIPLMQLKTNGFDWKFSNTINDEVVPSILAVQMNNHAYNTCTHNSTVYQPTSMCFSIG